MKAIKPFLETDSLLQLLVALIFLAYVTWGIFFSAVPSLKPDDVGEVARADYFAKNLRQDDPLLPAIIAPFYAGLWNGSLLGQGYMLMNAATGALFISLFPANEIFGFRLGMFAWSIALCLVTYALAKRLGMSKKAAIVSVAWLVAAPEFFTQIHSSRTEVMLATFYVLCLNLFICLQEQKGLKSDLLIALTALFSCVPAIMVHPSGFYISATLFILYLVSSRQSLLRFRSVLITISMIAGATVYLYVLLGAAHYAKAVGGGNLLDLQGPPLLSRNLWWFLKTPLHFYERLSEFNDYSKIGSCVWLVFASFAFTRIARLKDDLYAKQKLVFLIGVLAPIALLSLLSGSYGPYNITIFPLAAIVLGRYSELLTVGANGRRRWDRLCWGAGLGLIFVSNFVGVSRGLRVGQEYRALGAEIRNVIPLDSAVLGTTFYYLGFKEQPYFSSWWLYETIGNPGESFADGVRKLNVEYIIADDHFVGMAVRFRDAAWVQEMMDFLDTKCESAGIFFTDIMLKEHVLDPSEYPKGWRYPEMKKNVLRRVRVYRVKD